MDGRDVMVRGRSGYLGTLREGSLNACITFIIYLTPYLFLFYTTVQ